MSNKVCTIVLKFFKKISLKKKEIRNLSLIYLIEGEMKYGLKNFLYLQNKLKDEGNELVTNCDQLNSKILGL